MRSVYSGKVEEENKVLFLETAGSRLFFLLLFHRFLSSYRSMLSIYLAVVNLSLVSVSLSFSSVCLPIYLSRDFSQPASHSSLVSISLSLYVSLPLYLCLDPIYLYGPSPFLYLSALKSNLLIERKKEREKEKAGEVGLPTATSFFL